MTDVHAPAQIAADPASHHGDAPHDPPRYYFIWFVLLLITIAEVIVASFITVEWLKRGLLVGMTLWKVALVALHFMHLRFEKRTLWIVASAPLFLGVILWIGTYPDAEKGHDWQKHGELRSPEMLEQHK